MAKLGANIGTAVLAASLAAGVAWAAGEETHIERQPWTFAGMFGRFDEAQLQRGFKVYVEVCQRCHSIKRLYFRNLVQPGGPSFSEAAIKSIAGNDYQVDDVPDEQGKINKRPATLADSIPPPYPNEQAARYAQNGALPPDLSLIARAPRRRCRNAILSRPRHNGAGYPEQLSGGGRRLHLRLSNGLRGAAGRHEDGRVH